MRSNLFIFLFTVSRFCVFLRKHPIPFPKMQLYGPSVFTVHLNTRKITTCPNYLPSSFDEGMYYQHNLNSLIYYFLFLIRWVSANSKLNKLFS